MVKRGYKQLYESFNKQPLEIMTKGGRQYECPNGMPVSVIVKGKHVPITYHSRIYSLQGVALRGMVMYSQRIIVIDPTMSLHMMRETLYHEMAHMYLHDWQEKSKHLRKLTPAQVEDICDMFSEGHYDAICNNNPLTD